MPLADFNIVAVDPVVTYFKSGDPGSFFFSYFKIDQVLTGIGTQIAELIQFCVESFGNNASLPDDHRRILDDGSLQ